MKTKIMAVALSALLVIGALGGIAYATDIGQGKEADNVNNSTASINEDEILKYIKKNNVTSISGQGMDTGTMNEFMGTFDYQDMNEMMRSTDMGDMYRMMENVDFEDMNRMMESMGMGNMSDMMKNMGQMMNGMMGQGMGNMMGR